jgi:hypothetical protein
MEALLNIIVPLAEKYGPGIVADIVAAFKTAGYTVAQVDAIFAQIQPYDQLGINPNAPVKPETTPAVAPPAAPPTSPAA